MRLLATLVFATMMGVPLGSAAQLKVMISGGFSGPYEKLVPQFESATGIKVTTLSGASQGTGPQTIGAQLARGVPVDVVILSREGLGDLIKAGRIAAGTDADLAQTPIGVAVRAGAPKPDVRTVESFKQALLAAKLVTVPGSTSGIFLTKEILPRIGVADKVKVQVTPRGAQAAEMVASGKADLALLPVSEIVHAPGVEVAGVIAEEIQLHQVFATAVVQGSSEMEAGKRLIAFLTSAQAAPTIRQGGMEPAKP